MLAPSMFLTGFAAGFFFAAICHQNRSLIVDVNTAGLALVPIWMLGSLVFLRDMQLVLLSAAVVFLALGVGFLLIGLVVGSVTGFSKSFAPRQIGLIGATANHCEKFCRAKVSMSV